MIEQMLEINESQRDKAHFRMLTDLYALMVTLSRFYESFFRDAFPPEEPQRYAKVQVMINEIRSIILT